MSSNTFSTFFIIAALLYATTNPLTHAFFFNQITTLTVTGTVCCTNTGTCAAGSVGIATATATLNCPTGQVATTITDAAGNFAFTAVNLPQPASPSLCTVIFSLPLTGTAATSCSLLATGGGSLVGPVVITNNGIFNGGIFNLFGGTRNVFGTAVIFVRNLL